MRNQCRFELRQMRVAFDATESRFGNEQCGGSPAHHHPGITPAFDPPRPGLRARKAAFDEVRRRQALAQPFVDSKPMQRQRLFQPFFQAARGRRTDRVEPLHAGAQLFECFLGISLGPGAPQTPGGLLLLFPGKMLQHVAQFVDAASLNQGVLAEHFLDRLVQRLGAVEHDEDGAFGVQSAFAQIDQKRAHDRAVLRGAVPQAQHVFLAVFIHAQRDDEVFAAEALPVEQERHQLGRHGPLNEFFQLRRRGDFPMPAHAAFADAVTFQAIVNRTGVVAGGNLAYQFAGHRALHPPVLLKEPVTLQRGFTGCFVAQPGTLDRHFASVKDDVAGLGAVTIMGLLAPGAAAPLDLLAHIAVHDLEAEIGADRFDVVFHFQDQVQHREGFLQRCRFRRFEAGFCQQIAVLSFHAFGVFGFVFHSPPSLSARRPNHQSHFQLRCGHSPVLGVMFAYDTIQKNGSAYQQHPVICIITDFVGSSLSGFIFYFGSGWLARRKERKIKQAGDDEFYDEVARELQEKSLVAGLWTKAFAEMDGDDAKARALYIKYRVANLKDKREAFLKQKREEELNAGIKLARETAEREKKEAEDREMMKQKLMTICKKCGYAGSMEFSLICSDCKCPKCSHRFDWYYVPSKDLQKAQS